MDVGGISKEYAVRALTMDDAGRILRVCDSNPLFYEYHPPFASRESIAEDIAALPPGKSREDKLYIGFFKGGELAAVMDLILGYPDARTGFIGFFMVDGAISGRGVGSAIITECGEWLARRGFTRMRLAVDKGNPQSFAFWSKNGFVSAGEVISDGDRAYLPMEKRLP